MRVCIVQWLRPINRSASSQTETAFSRPGTVRFDLKSKTGKVITISFPLHRAKQTDD